MTCTDNEPNRAILLGFLKKSILPMLHPKGLWVAPDPAPLSAEVVESVLREVAEDNNYQHQILFTRTNDGWVVELNDGEISKEKLLP
jgi:hypothetical protein